jgi:photosystem II stability/assembly factor-like uncharacterized protein
MLIKNFSMFIQHKKYFVAIIFLIFLMVSVSSVYAQGWLFQNPYPTSQSLSGVKFVSPQKGWIIGMEGTILYTEDAGNTWEIQESGTEQYLTSIFFINEKMGWIVGTKGIILYTEDGGKKWVLQDSGSDSYALHKVFFINSQEGWIVGNDINKDEGFLLYTKDGGKKWEKQFPGKWLKIASIFFIDSNTGWFLAGDKVFRTTDCGKNWDYSFLPIPDSQMGLFRRGEAIPEIGSGWRGDVFFADSKRGWAVVGLWYIFYTDDGGKTWKTQFSGENMSYGLDNFFFADTKRGCIGGSTIFCTEDGVNWKERLGTKPMGRISLNGFLVDIWGGNFVTNDIAWAVGPYGLIMKTEDGGKNWGIKIRGWKDLPHITFINPKIGLGTRSSGSLEREIGAGGLILKTDDGGDTWKIQKKFMTPINITSSHFVNPTKGWMVGYQWKHTPGGSVFLNSIVLHTHDQGNAWITQFKESAGELQYVYFVDTNRGWVVGENGIIFYTDDGGKNWKRQKSETVLHLHGVYFVDAKKGWVIGDSGVRGLRDEGDPQPEGVILHTNDGGEHWRIQWTKKDVWLNGLFFVDSNKGYVTGDSRLLLSTEDGGKTWVEEEVAWGFLGTPFFIDTNRGWIQLLDEEGNVIERIILVTEDGGKTWVKQKTGLHKYPWRPFNEKTPQK